MKKITVNENEEFRVKVITAFNESEFFYDSFLKAKEETESIVKDTINYHNTKNDTMLDFSNNIIAFSGDRGQGKSSAMLSFSNLLDNCRTNPYKEFLGNFLNTKNYVVLDRIDPTKLEDKDNILLMVIGKLFNKFCNLWNESDKNNLMQYSNLLEHFQLCYDEIMTIKTLNESECFTTNPLDVLGKIGDSGNLKKDLWKLLELFFDFENRCTNRNYEKDGNYLVIQLDDTDLNTQTAYKIVEDVRKYFMIPNVIILMAIDISQLTKAIEQYFINRYQVYNEYYEKRNLFEHRKVAVKYIDKLIPGNRKIFLPKLTLITGENAEKVKLEYLDVNKNNILYFKSKKGDEIYDIQELIMRLIYEKTGMIFVKPKTYIHDIIPRTMRELVNFLSILNKMPNIKNDYVDLEDLNLRMDNLKKFETYFIEVWIPNNVHLRYQENVTNFIVASMPTKNKQLIKDIKAKIQPVFIDEYSKVNESLNSNTSIIKLIRNIEIKGVYSFDNIRTVLNAFEDEFPQEDTYKFIFAIETLYSIYISKTLCSKLISEKNNEPFDVDLLDFIGGKIFSDDEVNNFIRKQKGAINRGAFEIETSYNTETQKSIEKLLVVSNLLSFFFNFDFRFYQGKLQNYKRPYKSANGAKSTKFKYEALSPIIKCIEPELFLNRLDFNNVSYNEDKAHFDNIRYQCIKIISNVDLINYISKKLQDYSLMRSDNWEYYEHLNNLYERLELCINDLSYYDFSIDLFDLKNEIIKNGANINNLFDIYKDIDSDLDEITIDILDKLAVYVTKLGYLSGTETLDRTRKKISSLSRRLQSYNRVLKDEELEIYIHTLNTFDEKITSSEGYWDGNFKDKYNEIVKELKYRFEYNQDG